MVNYALMYWKGKVQIVKCQISVTVPKKSLCFSGRAFWSEIFLQLAGLRIYNSGDSQTYTRVCLVRRLSNRTIFAKVGLREIFFCSLFHRIIGKFEQTYSTFDLK